MEATYNYLARDRLIAHLFPMSKTRTRAEVQQCASCLMTVETEEDKIGSDMQEVAIGNAAISTWSIKRAKSHVN